MRCCRRSDVVDAERLPSGNMRIKGADGETFEVISWDEFVSEFEAMAISVELKAVEDDAATG